MITDTDITKLKKVFVTKDDLTIALNNYPTKDDLAIALSNYPTKDDLKHELQNYPTKNDLKNEFDIEFNKISMEFVTKTEFRNLEAKVDGIGGMVRKILEGTDAFVRTFTILEEEYHALAMSDTRQNNQIDQIAKHTGIKLAY